MLPETSSGHDERMVQRNERALAVGALAQRRLVRAADEIVPVAMDSLCKALDDRVLDIVQESRRVNEVVELESLSTCAIPIRVQSFSLFSGGSNVVLEFFYSSSENLYAGHIRVKAERLSRSGRAWVTIARAIFDTRPRENHVQFPTSCHHPSSSLLLIAPSRTGSWLSRPSPSTVAT